MTSQHLIPSLRGQELGTAANDFVIVEWSDAGESEWEWIAPLHIHHSDEEAWYVLEGALRFRMGEEIFEAGPGAAGPTILSFSADVTIVRHVGRVSSPGVRSPSGSGHPGL